MPVLLGGVKVNAVNSGGSINVGELNLTSTHSKMNMQGASGSFTNGDANLINNPLGGNLISQVNDPDVADVQAG